MDLDAIPPAPRSPSPLAVQLVTGGGPAGRVLNLVGVIFVAVGILVAGILFAVKIPAPFFALPLIFPAIGLMLIAGAKVAQGSRDQVFRNGSAAAGKVIFSGPDSRVRINGCNPFQLRYQFSTDQGVFTGSVSSMNMTVLQALPKDGQVPVLYDPRNPRRNTLYVE
jgi:hypothetical protein